MFFVSFLYYLLSTNSLISLSFYALLKASKKKLRYCSVRFLSSPAATEHWSEATTIIDKGENHSEKRVFGLDCRCTLLYHLVLGSGSSFLLRALHGKCYRLAQAPCRLDLVRSHFFEIE